MAPIPLKTIVSVSSEDKLNPASNLLSSSGAGKWLCAADDKSGKAEVVIQLAKRARIASLEICNFGSAFVEVLVSDTSPSGPTPSSSSSPAQEVTLLHTSMLMSFQESRSGRNRNKTAIYGRDKLSASAASSKWNRVKIRCVQKYNTDTQFGLRSVAVYPDSHDPSLPRQPSGGVATSPLLSPPSSSSARHSSLSTPKQGATPGERNTCHFKYPSLPTLESPSSSRVSPKDPASKSQTPASSKSQTPKRRSKDLHARDENPDDDFEFSGIENQSRLFHDCIRGKLDDSTEGEKSRGQNRILEKIVAEKDKYQEVVASPAYKRRKLLRKELPKTDVMRDFVESYKDTKKSVELTGAARRLSSHDNDYEIGEEPEFVWGKFHGKPKRRHRPGGKWKKSKADSEGISGWLTKRNKLGNMIEHCSDILKRVGQVESGCEVIMAKQDDTPEVADGKREVLAEVEACNGVGEELCQKGNWKEEEEGEEVRPDTGTGSDSPLAGLVECPLCLAFFPSYAVEVHASQCGDSLSSNNNTFNQGIIILD